MLVLGLNTVADVCEAALVRDGVQVAGVSEPMTQGHDARLAPVVEQVMREAGVGFADLDRIAVIVGPGSFTGVRVGVSFARALALALDIPVVGVSSLEALDGMTLGRALGVLPAKRRPPERTWWVQKLVDGRGVSEPAEADARGVVDLLAGQDVICGNVEGLDAAGVAAAPGACSAGVAGMFAGRLAEDDLPAARPIYVREPDAAPMRPVRT
jgi:tRNA threonylcarbamoyladenosine biosynthesis protein TsaB